MTNPNEPAFIRRQIPRKPPQKDDAVYEHGLTKREYFAAMAMQGILAQGEIKGGPGDLARSSVLSSDALIAELNK